MILNRILKFMAIICLIFIHRTEAELVELDEGNWRLMLDGEWMVEFFAPWCPACKNLSPIWSRFAKTALDEGVKVAKVDVTKSPSLSGRFFVTALPTIYHVHNGEFRQYRGSRDAESFYFFIKQKQWQKIDSLSAWKQPDSIHMSLLSYFFKLSHYLKDINTQLHEEYGLPTWGAYGLFAMATILIGAILGLFLVCVVDFLYPPKKAHRQSFSESNKNIEHSVEDIDDDLEDDEPEKDDETAEEEEENLNDEKNKKDDNDNSEDNGGNNSDTSDGEKNSNSEDESEDIGGIEQEGKVENLAKQDNDKDKDPSPPEVRKRKPRKAD